ncbi:MAG TPA: carbonic anhydrase family protein [Acidimicrobiales bacterium]|nr:carbonic anhydrase family protein [Acidimicrobiales bacterium]
MAREDQPAEVHMSAVETLATRRLSRRQLLKYAGIGAGALAVPGVWSAVASAERIPAATPLPPWNHDPTSPIGPLHWGTIGYPVCASGMAQSPIDIVDYAFRPYSGPSVALNYEESELEIENTGHVFEVVIPAGATNTLTANGVTYPLVQYHFHVPSEHKVNGRAADLEAHFVHTTSSGETAVLGVLYNVGPEPNEVLDRIILSAPAVAGQTLTGGEANPADLLPDNFTGTGDYHVGNFYTYAGSLTTPGCTEGVRWVVMRNGGEISQAAVNRFHRAISHFPNYAGYASNTRPVQPLNGRTIGFSNMGNG